MPCARCWRWEGGLLTQDAPRQGQRDCLPSVNEKLQPLVSPGDFPRQASQTHANPLPTNIAARRTGESNPPRLKLTCSMRRRGGV